MAREYVLWPGAKSFPSSSTYPNSYGTVEDDVTEVHSKLGSVWERVSDSDSAAIAEAARNAYQVSQDAAADYTSTATFPVSLDRITPSAQYTAVDTAVVREVWSRVVTAEKGTFLQVTADMIAANSITSDKLKAGAIDGQVITGATIRTAASGARIEMTSQALRAIDSSGNVKVNINPSSGIIMIDGAVGISDTWSSSFFSDMRYLGTNTDISNTGEYVGVGLRFQATDENWGRQGVISIVRDGPAGTGTPRLRLQAPKRADSRAPYMNLDVSGLYFWAGTGSGNLDRYLSFGANSLTIQCGDSENSRMYLRDNYFWAGSNLYYTMATKAGFYYNSTSTNAQLSVNSNGFVVSNSSTSRVYANSAGIFMTTNNLNRYIGINASACVMSWDRDHQAITNVSYGITQRGGKNFIMTVPGLSEEHDGKDLLHSCTESPYDGIEYWGDETVPESGNLRVALPDYVPVIHNREAPHTLQVTSSSGAPRAWLDLEAYEVVVEDEPGARVYWLVKMARLMDRHDEETGEVVLYGREFWKDPWVEPLQAQIMEPEED